MLRLNKEKEDLLVDKYGFEKLYSGGKTVYYKNKLSRTFTIYSYEHPYKGKVDCYSFSRNTQDIVYDLIKADVLIKVPNEDKEAKINNIKNQINILQSKLKNLEG